MKASCHSICSYARPPSIGCESPLRPPTPSPPPSPPRGSTHAPCLPAHGSSPYLLCPTCMYCARHTSNPFDARCSTWHIRASAPQVRARARCDGKPSADQAPLPRVRRPGSPAARPPTRLPCRACGPAPGRSERWSGGAGRGRAGRGSAGRDEPAGGAAGAIGELRRDDQLAFAADALPPQPFVPASDHLRGDSRAKPGPRPAGCESVRRTGAEIRGIGRPGSGSRAKGRSLRVFAGRRVSGRVSAVTAT